MGVKLSQSKGRPEFDDVQGKEVSVHIMKTYTRVMA
jgi:hypothetical protein